MTTDASSEGSRLTPSPNREAAAYGSSRSRGRRV